MKFVLVIMLFLLSGCAVEDTFETVADEPVQAVMAEPREITVRLPDNALAPALQNETEQVYICEDYEILLERRQAGDLDATFRAVSGYGKEQLTVMETQWDDVTRYEFVWAAAGERGDLLGRAVVLDDGHYHYCLSVLRDGETVSQVVWRDVFASFALV